MVDQSSSLGTALPCLGPPSEDTEPRHLSPKARFAVRLKTLFFRSAFPTEQSPLTQDTGQEPTALLPWGLQKQQMGDTLREVHMQQLQVRSAQYHEKIEEKNEDLLQLKLTAAKTVQVLNSCKVSECPSTSVLTFFCF